MPSLAADPTEPLENGCQPSTPAGDNLVLDHLRAEADAYAAMARSFGGRVHDVPGLPLRVTDLGVATPFGAGAFLHGPIADGQVEDLVAALRDRFAGTAGGPYLLYSPWPLADLADHGFARVGHPPLMFRPATPPAPGGEIAAPVGPDLRIERVHDAATLADFERTIVEAYPVPELQPWARGSLLRPAILDTPWRLFVGYDTSDGDRPVATAGAFVTDQLNLVELVSARPEVRGRGVGGALTAAAALSAPDRPAMLISSDPGRPVYDRLGFLPLTRYTLWLGFR